MSKIVSYARVSTQDQDPGMQLQALKDAGAPESHLFVEYVSARKNSRKQFNAALASLEKGDTLMVWKFDRASRSMLGLMQLVHDLDAHGITFVSLVEKLDTRDIHGKFMIAMFGYLAEMESRNISLRVRSGVNAAKRAGTYKGVPGHGKRVRKWTNEQIKVAMEAVVAGRVTIEGLRRQSGLSRYTLNCYFRWYLCHCENAVIPRRYQPLAQRHRDRMKAALKFDPMVSQCVDSRSLRRIDGG